MLRLKKSKTDVDHSEVQIMLIAINESTCLVRVLRHLFLMNLQSINVSLFRLIEKIETFTRVVVIKELKNRLLEKNINAKSYSSHSFRKKATCWTKTFNAWADERLVSFNYTSKSQWKLDSIWIWTFRKIDLWLSLESFDQTIFLLWALLLWATSKHQTIVIERRRSISYFSLISR
jgi:hypothetical protein